MVKAVVGEEARLPLVEDRLAQSSLPAEALTDFHTLLFIDEIVNLRILISVSLFVRFFFQVGLVIGKLSSALDRGFVFDLIPTPQNDSGEPACALTGTSKDDKKKGSKSKSQAADSSSLFIDKEWVAEHALQVR